MKTICYPILGIVVLFALASCGGGESQADSDSTGTYVPKLDRLVRSNIEKVKTDPWDKNTYLEIRDYQIPKMKGQKKQTECLKLLKLNACLSMEKALKELMETHCTKDNYRNNHKQMDALYAELTGKEFKDVDTGDSLHARNDYAIHKKLYDQVGKQYASVKVSSYEDRYDPSYDNSVRSESKRLYDSHTLIANHCYYLKNGLTNVSFRERHRKYCEAIVSFYEKETSWEEGKENKVETRLNTFESEFRNSADWKNWNDRIASVKNKFAQP